MSETERLAKSINSGLTFAKGIIALVVLPFALLFLYGLGYMILSGIGSIARHVLGF